MLLRHLQLTLFLCFFNYGFSQRENIQTIDAESIQKVILEVDEVFEVTIKTTSSSEIKINSISEGEYLQQIGLKREVKNNTLQLTSSYREILTSGYDKLSAHKVYAVNLEIELPENLELVIVSNTASVYAKGNYKSFEVELKDGQLFLKEFSGKALINTFEGNVFVKTKQANVKAESNSGNIKIDPELDFGKLIEIKTISGNITVKKIE